MLKFYGSREICVILENIYFFFFDSNEWNFQEMGFVKIKKRIIEMFKV